jgi:PAS domain S-box-containing protein
VLAAAATALLLAVLSAWFLAPGSQSGRRLCQASYDWSQSWFPAVDLKDAAVAIVYLDLESFLKEKQDPRAPWSRTLHAELVRRLAAAKARAVVFDVIFDQADTNAAADRDFAAAMRASGNVVLAAELARSSRETLQTEGIESLHLALPAPMFLDAAAGWGIANVNLDDDFVVRQQFEDAPDANAPNLLIATARVAGLASAPAHDERWLRYYGAPLTLPHVEYSAALHADEVRDDFFRGKIVLVGARPMAGTILERKDEFRSPLSSWGSPDLFMPAVEVHATELLNVIRGDSLRRLSTTAELLILVVCAVVVTGTLFRLRPLPSAGLAVTLAAATLLLARAVLIHGQIWFPWLIICAVQLPGALGGSVLWQSLEWYRQKRQLQAQRRAAEEKIREQAALIEKARDAILVEDLHGNIIYANPSVERIYGWRSEELLSRNAAAQSPPPLGNGEFAEARRVTLQTGEWAGELEQCARDGRRLTLASRCTLIRDETGAPKSFLFINTDITEKKRLELEFFRAQRIDGIGALANGIAHDLNNALAPVLMGLQFMQKHSTDDEDCRMLSLMEANTQRGAEMVRQVLLFSRGRNAGNEPLAPANLLREMERIARQTFPKSINVAALAPADLWPVQGNATQLHQVLLNLCVNARDAMPDGGQLTLAADNAELTVEEAGRIAGGVAGRFVMLVVSDTGAGIAPEHLPHIFEPFFTTKPVGQGTGLGLSTLARIVNQHGGFVNVRSELGTGTTFEVYLPAAQARPAADTRRPAREQFPRGHGQTILVVDDEFSVREMISIGLEAEGYAVKSAATGFEAIAAIENSAAQVELVLLDSDMPGLDGSAAEPILSAKAPGLPIIRMTGNAQAEGTPERSRILTKPFQLDELLRLVAAVMAEKK